MAASKPAEELPARFDFPAELEPDIRVLAITARRSYSGWQKVSPMVRRKNKTLMRCRPFPAVRPAAGGHCLSG
ncbi:hypothetical protein [Streptomyces sp. NPDC004065]|uniref:hypothetical protein n=1 Tax=Streptomyces sp. NPDC004065 TaxID=3364689 RepID=UPI00384AE1D5